jgi:hypothetical protein
VYQFFKKKNPLSFFILKLFRHEKLVFSESKKPMEIDILIPKHNLAIEYYGEQHFLFHFLQGDPEEQQRRDSEKRIKCAELGITLIEVPYWWDRSSSKRKLKIKN